MSTLKPTPPIPPSQDEDPPPSARSLEIRAMWEPVVEKARLFARDYS